MMPSANAGKMRAIPVGRRQCRKSYRAGAGGNSLDAALLGAGAHCRWHDVSHVTKLR
jgi:hypothetical protein